MDQFPFLNACEVIELPASQQFQYFLFQSLTYPFRRRSPADFKVYKGPSKRRTDFFASVYCIHVFLTPTASAAAFGHRKMQAFFCDTHFARFFDLPKPFFRNNFFFLHFFSLINFFACIAPTASNRKISCEKFTGFCVRCITFWTP